MKVYGKNGGTPSALADIACTGRACKRAALMRKPAVGAYRKRRQTNRRSRQLQFLSATTVLTGAILPASAGVQKKSCAR